MRRLVAALLCAFAGLALAAPAAAIDFGATEDEAKLNPAIYADFADVGLKKNVISVTWDPDNPTALPPDTAQIDRLLPVASANGVQVIFAIYQKRSVGLPSSPAAVAQFATWVQALARRFPQVKTYIGPNEPNQPRFWNPQFAADCSNASGETYFAAMAAMYDALKSVDASINVVGVGLSPRGNDNCRARSNVSTSPVRFLKYLGDAYRKSGRTTPIMDALSFHPYPNVNTDAPSKGYGWPNVGVPNLDRLKQAFWDAFGGTGQPTFEDGLKLDLDEVGWQVDTSSRPGYSGNENVPVVDEATQARYYAEVVRRAACDPAVDSLSFFHFVDEIDRDRFQSGLLRLDKSRRDSYDAVKAAIAEATRGCGGALTRWRHATTVIGARAEFGTLLPSSRKRSAWNFRATATEEALYKAGVFRVAKQAIGAAERAAISRSLTLARPTAVASTAGTLKANYNILVQMKGKRLAPGRYVYAIRLSAAMNPSRTSLFVSRPFVVR